MNFYKLSHKYYCGVDLHSRTLYLCIVGQDGAVLLHRGLPCDPNRFLLAIAPFREDLVDWFSDATGFRGWLALLDVPQGRSIGITFWATAEALDDELASGASLRNEIAAGLDTDVTTVERYEVVMIDTVPAD